MPLLAHSCGGCAVHPLGSFSSPGNSDVTSEYTLRHDIIDITGSGGGSGTFTVTFPAVELDDFGARKVIINSTNLSLRLRLPTGAVVDISPGAKIDCIFRPGGVYQVS